MNTDAQDRLIVALDVPSADEARELVVQLEGVVSFFKVGLELYTAAGPDLVREFVLEGKKVFLDCKFLDIDETVRRATESASRLGATFLTVHESGRVVAAAVEGCRGTGLKILAVTVLTSLDTADIQEMGLSCTAEELALRRAKRAIAAGCHGIVASGLEAKKVRALNGRVIIVTPGIRPAGSERNEQKRATTPTEAIQAGADYLVVGRPITRAPDAKQAAVRILEEIQRAFDSLKP